MSAPQKALRRFATYVQDQSMLFLQLDQAAKELLTRVEEEAEWERRLARLKEEEAVSQQTLKNLGAEHQRLLDDFKSQRATLQQAIQADRTQRERERKDWVEEIQTFRNQREEAQGQLGEVGKAIHAKECELAELEARLRATVEGVLQRR